MANFGPLAAENGSVVLDTPANFNGFRLLAALQHGTLVVEVSQTLRRWLLNRGRHLYSTWRPSRWALAHILVLVVSLAHVVLQLHFSASCVINGYVKLCTSNYLNCTSAESAGCWTSSWWATFFNTMALVRSSCLATSLSTPCLYVLSRTNKWVIVYTPQLSMQVIYRWTNIHNRFCLLLCTRITLAKK